MSNKETRENIQVRLAGEEDIELVYHFINELAEYEKMTDECVMTKEILFESMFVKHQAEAVIGEIDGKPVGFALFFENFSTFLGKANLYLEDIFIRPEYRKKGLGKKFFEFLAGLCQERGYQRLDWCCLDWNQPSLDFYQRMGAKPMSDWILHRLDEEAIGRLCN